LEKQIAAAVVTAFRMMLRYIIIKDAPTSAEAAPADADSQLSKTAIDFWVFSHSDIRIVCHG
jgi:hypothetical protein